jgi:hypothetical protein
VANLVAGGLGAGDPLDHRHVAVVIGLSPALAVALEEEDRERERDALVAVGEGWLRARCSIMTLALSSNSG